MSEEIVPSPLLPARSGGFPVPALIAAAGHKASEHFLEFFAARHGRRGHTSVGVAGVWFG